MLPGSQIQRPGSGDTLPRWIASSLLVFAVIMLSVHWVHLTADPPWKFYPGHLQSLDWSGDFFTDEGWELNAAAQAVMTGKWYVPGELNLAVDAPLFPILLYLPFKLFGVSMWVARTFDVACFSASILMICLFLSSMISRTSMALVAALLSINFFAFIFSRSALVEPVMVFFVVASLLAAKQAARAGSKTLALVAGFILSLGLLTKLSAISGALPLLAVLWILSSARLKLPNSIAAICGIVPLPLLHRILIVAKYKQDHDYYTYINITERGVTGLKSWLFSIVRIGAGLHYIGPLLYISCLLSVCLFFWKKRQPLDQITKICFVWLVSCVAIFSRVTYYPPRYCLAFLFPLVILAVQSPIYVSENNRLLGRGLYSLIGLALLFDTGQILAYSLRPHYSFVNFAEAVRSAVPPDSLHKCAIIGDISNTVSLYTGIPSVNLATGPGPAVPRIERCDPAIYVNTAPISDETVLAFTKSNRSVTFDRAIDVLNNYKTGRPLYIYTIHKQ